MTTEKRLRHETARSEAFARVPFVSMREGTRANIAFAAIGMAWMLFPAAALAADFNTGGPDIPIASEEEERVGGIRGKLHDWKVTAGFGAVYLPELKGRTNMRSSLSRSSPRTSATASSSIRTG